MRGLLQLALDLWEAPSPVPVAEPSLPPLSPASARFVHPRATRQTRLGEVPVAYEFRRGKRRTIGMAVGTEGLTVSAPRWVPLHEVEAALQEKAAWIVRKLEEMQTRQQRLEAARIDWQAGAVLPWLGQPLTLALDADASPDKPGRKSARRAINATLEIDHTTASPDQPRQVLRLNLPEDTAAPQIRNAVHAWLLREARVLFMQRLDHFAPLLNVQWRKLALSNARTRWGSASSDGRIHLNWRLMHFRLEVIDYVVAHELSHLRVMDHSPRFWETVRSVVPDYEKWRDELRDAVLPQWT